MNCYCGNEKSFSDCCEPIHADPTLASTAESLMRARYSAYASGNIDFIKETHDPKTRNELDFEGIKSWSRQNQWDKLEVLSEKAGGDGQKEGWVEFKAHYSNDLRQLVHHEHSYFRHDGGRWYYMDGEDLSEKTYVRAQPKVGRNDPCPCGSGKKYKKCCLQ